MFSILVMLLILPVVAIGLIFMTKHSRHIPDWLEVLLDQDQQCSAYSIICFYAIHGPNCPYELSRDAWYPIYEQCPLSLYAGLGLGVVSGATAVSPV